MKTNERLTSSIMVLIALLAVSRLLPHWPNFTPVAAMALFGGAAIANRWRAFMIPLAAMLLSDLALGAIFGWDYAFHSAQPFVYMSFILTVALGRLFRNAKPWQTVLGGGTVASVLFFLITNAAVWAMGDFYPHTLSGLLLSYEAGLAFYRDGGNFFLNSLFATYFFGGLLFVATSIVERRTTSAAVN